MESFLPSEIARLVYGYLEEEECHNAALTFLEKSSHLKECLFVANRGRKFNTRIYGMTLIDLLDLLSEAVRFANDHRTALMEDSKKNYYHLTSFLHDNLSSGIQEPETNLVKCCDSTLTVSENQKKGERVSRNSFGSFKSYKNVEGVGSRTTSMSSQTNNSHSHNLKVKEENIEDIAMEDCGDVEEVPDIEPEVEISALESPPTQQAVSTTPTLKMVPPWVLRGNGVGGNSTQLVCQPYSGLLQLLPTYHPTAQTVYLPPHHVVSMSQQPSPVQNQPTTSQPTLYQATVQTSTSSTVQSVWSKTKSPCQEQQKNGKGGPKLRPIAPKITHSLENSMKLQVVHSKENPRVESSSCISRRNLRSRKKNPVRKNQATSTVFSKD